MQKVKFYKCPSCNKQLSSLGGWSSHVETMHPNTLPQGYTYSRYFYYILTGKTQGNCIVCKSPTTWNETTMKYNRFCGHDECKKAYIDLCNKRIIGKHGKSANITINANGKAHLLNDPDQQRKMVSNRSISGSYKFNDGIEIPYVGSYEKSFLMMLDTFLNFPTVDIIAPSPHTYYYEYKNEDDKDHEGNKFYIPDFYIPSLNLEIEIKENTNQHPKIIAVDKVKEKLKDELMKSNKDVNYIKVVENDFSNFFAYFLKLKNEIPNNGTGNIYNTKTISTEASFPSEEDYNIAQEGDTSHKKIIEIKKYFRYSKAIALCDIPEGTIIKEGAVSGPKDGSFKNMRFTDISNAVMSNIVSSGGNVIFKKHINGIHETYDIVAKCKISERGILKINASRDFPEFYRRV